MINARRLGALIGTALTFAILVPATAGEAVAASPVRISSVQYDSPGSDTGTNYSRNAEWVRITNYSSTKRSLSGWTLRDAQNHVYRFGTFSLGAGKSVRVHTGRGTNTSTDRYWGSSWYVWNNTNDKAILRNSAGTTVSSRSW